jgi:DNA-binding transcriptional MerR regulator
MVENKEYLIHELANQANVSVRTIRYYLDEGLLPPPQVKGRYALFNSEHLDRLELIRRLKDAYLPLKEIRQKMEALSGAEVSDLLKKSTDQLVLPLQNQPAFATVQKIAESSALDYIARLLETHPASQSARSSSQAMAANPAAARLAMPQPEKDEAENETWRRVVLAPGVELHLRQPVGSENEKKIRKILDLANRLFRS